MATENRFEAAWQKEVERLRNAWEIYKRDIIDVFGEVRTYSYGSPYRVALQAFWFGVFGTHFVTGANRLRKQDLDTFFIYCNTNGFDVTVQKRHDNYISFLSGKMLQSISKHVPKDYDMIRNIELWDSVKGYELSAKLQGEGKEELTINTQCIGAGGYNIQEYHYRYLTHIS